MKYVLRSLLRGTALFFGCFSLINTIVSQLGSSRLEDIWWIDLSFMPSSLATVLALALAFALCAFAIKPHMSAFRKVFSGVLTLIFSVIALVNATAYYQALAQGSISSSFPVPFSLVVSVLFFATAVAMFTMHTRKASLAETIWLFIFALLWLILFPLAQIYTFGHTNYEAKSEVAVVFGARVYPSGTPSPTVKNRLDTAIDLYERGLVDTLLLTGAVDSDGIDETEGMLAYVVKKGVPRSVCVLDNQGSNTDASVKNTTEYFNEHDISEVLAVSQYYHLPRIKMAYRARRFNVRTVPAFAPQPIEGEYYSVLREVPAFWVYWLRSGLRDVGAR